MYMSRGFILSIPILALIGCGGGGDAASSSADSAPKQTAQAINPVDAATAGTITGSIKFSGTAPKMKKVSMAADAFCKIQHKSKVMAEDVVVGANGALKNAYVRIKSGLGNLPFPTPTEPAVLNQEGCVYLPHILLVRAGQDIVIKNSDGVLHNVNARPKKNKGFNVGQPVKGMKTTKKFAKEEVGIRLKCDVHPWMGGYIHVANHPYHAVSQANGKFTLTNVPPGTYEIEAWHEKLGSSVQKVTVGAKETKTVNFSFSNKSS